MLSNKVKSLSIIISSAKSGIPCNPSFVEMIPSFIIPFFDNSKSSACWSIKEFKSWADFIILDINLVFWIVFKPSVNAIIPFFWRRPNSVILLPSRLLVKDAVGKMLILDLSRPLRFKKSTIDTLSIIGSVLGIVTTDVTPPDKAALLSVLKFSLYSYPGSPTKTLMSTIPGNICLPWRSITFSLEGILFLLTFFPIASTKPFSSIINPPTSFNELCVSIIFAFKKYCFFIYVQKIFKQAILTATPNSTCSLITLLFMSSAKFVSISIPLFIGPGCIIKASSLA